MADFSNIRIENILGLSRGTRRETKASRRKTETNRREMKVVFHETGVAFWKRVLRDKIKENPNIALQPNCASLRENMKKFYQLHDVQTLNECSSEHLRRTHKQTNHLSDLVCEATGQPASLKTRSDGSNLASSDAFNLISNESNLTRSDASNEVKLDKSELISFDESILRLLDASDLTLLHESNLTSSNLTSSNTSTLMESNGSPSEINLGLEIIENLNIHQTVVDDFSQISSMIQYEYFVEQNQQRFDTNPPILNLLESQRQQQFDTGFLTSGLMRPTNLDESFGRVFTEILGWNATDSHFNPKLIPQEETNKNLQTDELNLSDFVRDFDRASSMTLSPQKSRQVPSETQHVGFLVKPKTPAREDLRFDVDSSTSNPEESRRDRFDIFENKNDSNVQVIDVTNLLRYDQKTAGRYLGMSESSFSGYWRKSNIERKWPYKKICKLEKKIETLRRQTDPTNDVLNELKKLVSLQNELLLPATIKLKL
jgi:hypothetical protein